MSIPLLTTKFYPPPARKQLVSRPLLAGRIVDGIQQGRSLTLISAPAGFGKTTLIVEAAHALGWRLAWISLDSTENDPILFWRYIVTAVRRLEPGIAELVQAALEAPQPPPIENILTTFLNDLAGLDDPILLVLDDYQTIDSGAVHTSLGFFLDHLPQQVHLALTTRADPPLSLARRRGRLELMELRAADLRFSQRECVDFLNGLMKLNLSPNDVDLLARRTEGWVAGLQMVALALQAPTLQDRAERSAFVASFAGDDQYIGDYLVEEVLQRQPAHVQDFLLVTSILERLSGGVCDALTGRTDGADMLKSLYHANLFVAPLDNREEWFRYHRLFSELLVRRLRQTEQPEAICALHARASQWFAEHELWAEAIQHAHLGKDPALALRWISSCALIMFKTSEVPRWLDWVRNIPEELVAADPQVCVFWGWAALATGCSDEVVRANQAIERVLGVTTDLLAQGRETIASLPPDLVNLLVVVATQRTSIKMDGGTARRVEAILNCLADLPEVEAYSLAFTMLPVLHFNTGISYEFQGDIAKAMRAFDQAIQTSQKYSNPHILPMAMSHQALLRMTIGDIDEGIQTYRAALERSQTLGVPPSDLTSIVHAGLGEALFERNELDEAKEHYAKALLLGGPWNNWETMSQAYPGLARVHLAQGNREAALALLDEAERRWRADQPASVHPSISILRVMLAEPGVQQALAQQMFDALSLPDTVNQLWYREMLTLIRARLLIILRRYDDALEELAPFLSEVIEKGQQGLLVRGLVWKVFALDALGRQEEALDVLEDTLNRAEAGQYTRTFVDAGLPMARLLYQLAQRPGIATPRLAYLARLLAAFPTGLFDLEALPAPKIEPPAGVLVEPLSEREREVLRLIAGGMTNGEIAARLVITAGTVKVHTNHIFAKLGVSNRTAAVARARALRLI